MKSLPIVCDDGVEPLVGQEGGPTPKVPKKLLAGPELGLANRMFSFRRTTEIRHVAVASSGAYVGVAYAGGQLAVWKLTGNKTVKLRARDHKAEPTTLEFHGSILMSADREGNVRALDVTKNKPLWHLRPTEKLNLGYVRTLLVDGDCLWVCGSGGSARVNLATGELLQALPAYARVLCAGRDAVSGRLALGAVGVVSVFGSDGERLAQYAVGDPTTGVVWVGAYNRAWWCVLQDGSVYRDDEPWKQTERAVSWTLRPVVQSDHQLVIGHLDGSVSVLCRDGDEAHVIQVHAGPIYDVLRLDDRSVLTTGQDGRIAKIQLSTGELEAVRVSRFRTNESAVVEGGVVTGGDEGILRRVPFGALRPAPPVERISPLVSLDVPDEWGPLRGVFVKGNVLAAVCEGQLLWRIHPDTPMVTRPLPAAADKGFGPHNGVLFNTASTTLLVRHATGMSLLDAITGTTLFETAFRCSMACFGNDFLLEGTGGDRGVVLLRAGGNVEDVDRGFANSFVVSRDGTQVALYGTGPSQHLLLVFGEGWQPTAEIVLDRPTRWVVWNSSGSHLAICGGAGDTRDVVLVSREGQVLADAQCASLKAWETDATGRLFALDRHRVLRAWQGSERIWESRLSADELQLGRDLDIVLDVSPDGTRLVVSGAAPRPLLLDAATGATLRVLDEVSHPLLHDRRTRASWLGDDVFVLRPTSIPTAGHQPMLYRRDGSFVAELCGHVATRASSMKLLEQTASGRVVTLDDPQVVPMLWSRDTGRLEAICTGTRPSGEDFRLACHKDGTSLAVGAGGRVTVHLIQ